MRPHTAFAAELRQRKPGGAAIYPRLRVAPSLPRHQQRPTTAARASVACPPRADSRVGGRGRPTRSRFLVVVMALGVLVVLPLIMIAGVIALSGSLAIGGSRRIRARASRSPRSDLAPVVALAGTDADFSLTRVA